MGTVGGKAVNSRSFLLERDREISVRSVPRSVKIHAAVPVAVQIVLAILAQLEKKPLVYGVIAPYTNS